MTRGRETEVLLEVPHGSVGRTGGRSWAKEREAAGINPDDETANMSPSEAIAYRLLREKEFVSKQTFYDTVFGGRKLKNPLSSLHQVMLGLRSKLPESIGETVVSVRSEGNSGYVLADLGKKQETIKRYRREEADRLRAVLDSRAPIRASKTIASQIEALLSLGKEVSTDDIINAVFGGKRTQNNLTIISRAVRQIDKGAQNKGQTLVRARVGGRKIYTKVNSEDSEKVKDELAKKRVADRAPKARAISKPPSPEIILEEDVEVDIIPLDGSELVPPSPISDFARIRNKRMSPEEIQATWQRIAWDVTEMFLSSMAVKGFLRERTNLEKNLEVILYTCVPEKRLAMFKKSAEINLPNFINAIRGTIEEAWAQTMTPEQADYAYMDKKYTKLLGYVDILKKQHISIEFVLKSLYEHFGLDIPAEHETAVSPYEKTAPRRRRRYPSHYSLKL